MYRIHKMIPYKTQVSVWFHPPHDRWMYLHHLHSNSMHLKQKQKLRRSMAARETDASGDPTIFSQEEGLTTK